MIFYFTFYFNPRSREGSDKKEDVSSADSGISIHAPAKGATNPRQVISAPYRISIHAPAKGATSSNTVLFTISTDFNPRSREGSDVLLPYQSMTHSQFQSTLPRRERLVPLQTSKCAPYFNPRSREGSDFPTLHKQFTHRNFNPRSREGSDQSLTVYPVLQDISIHAPAKGATW